MSRLLLSLGIIAAGLLIGYAIQRIVRARGTAKDLTLARPRRVLQVVALLVFNPIAAFSAIWAFQLDEIRIALMPLMGILTLVVGGSAGILLGRALKLPKPQAGAYFTSSGMFNIGSIGALVVFIFLGEAGFALVPFFRLFEEFSYYAFAFPIAKSFSPVLDTNDGGAGGQSVPAGGTTDSAAPRSGRRILRILADPFIIVAVASIALGFTLNLSGLERPAFFSTVNSIVIPIASLLLLVSIGMAMRFGQVGRYLKEAFLVAGTKFIIVPVIVVGVAAALGLGRIDGGLPLKVIVILSSVPVGFIALVPPSLYKLDVDLANSAWFITTALLAVVIPLQMLVVGWI